MIIFISFFILLSLTFIPYCVLKENNYNITLENPLNISNIKKNEIYNFYLQIKIKHDPKLRIKIIIPNEIAPNVLEGEIIHVSHLGFIDNVEAVEVIMFHLYIQSP